MDNEEIHVALKGHDKDIRSLEKRVDELEKTNDKIQNIVVAIERVTIHIDEMTKDMAQLVKRIENLEQQPVKTLDKIKWAVIAAIATGLISIILNNVL